MWGIQDGKTGVAAAHAHLCLRCCQSSTINSPVACEIESLYRFDNFSWSEDMGQKQVEIGGSDVELALHRGVSFVHERADAATCRILECVEHSFKHSRI